MQSKVHLVCGASFVATCRHICLYDVIQFNHISAFSLVRDGDSQISVIDVVVVEVPVVAVGVPRVAVVVTTTRPHIRAVMSAYQCWYE